MIHGAKPGRIGQGNSLRVRNRDDRDIRKLPVERHQFRHVQSAVQCRDVRPPEPAGHREMQLGDVKVQDVELLRTLRDGFDLQDETGEVIATADEALRGRANRDELR